MIEEEEIFAKEFKAMQKAKAYNDHFQKEMGSAAEEARVESFMKKRTLGGVDIIGVLL